jgi:hypothetical protein
MVRGNALKGQTGQGDSGHQSPVFGSVTDGSQLVGRGLAHKGKKAWVRRSAVRIMLSRFAQAQLAVHREPDLAGVAVLLPVIFPPADWA